MRISFKILKSYLYKINTRDIGSYEGNNMKKLKEDFINAINDVEEQDK